MEEGQVIKVEGESDTRNILLVNYTGKCFLCLQNFERLVEEEFDIGDRSPIGNHVSLLSIARYLKVNTAQIINPDDDLAPSSLIETSNVLVTLCDDCCPVVNRLSDLCLELEVLQMKLHHQLRSFHGVLECSGRDQDQGVLNSEFLTAPEILLRDKLLNECCRKLNAGIGPKVILEETPTTSAKSGPESRSSDDSISPADIIPPSPDSPPPRKRKRSTTGSKTKEDTKLHHAIWVDEAAARALPYNSRPVKCTLCRPHAQMKINVLTPHQIRRHLDSFFESHKDSNVPPSQFKLYCETAFKEQKLASTRTPESAGRAGWKCNLCSKTLVESRALYRHFILVHREHMAARIQNLQKIGDSGNKLEAEDTTWSGLVTCTICQPPRQLNSRSLRFHKIYSHVETLLTRHKAPGVSMSDFGLYCEAIFRQEAGCSGRTRGRNGWLIGRICGHCSKTLSTEQNLRRHLFLEHRDYMVQQIVDAQKSGPPPSLEIVSENIARKVAAEMGRAAPKRSSSKWRCKECGKCVANKFCLKRHTEHFCKLGGSKGGGKAIKCDLCGQGFRLRANLKRHQLQVHSLSLAAVHRQSPDQVEWEDEEEPEVKLDGVFLGQDFEMITDDLHNQLDPLGPITMSEDEIQVTNEDAEVKIFADVLELPGEDAEIGSDAEMILLQSIF